MNKEEKFKTFSLKNKIIVCLTDAEFSEGDIFSILSKLKKKAEKNNKEIIVVAKDNIIKTLKLLGFESLFVFEKNIESAIKLANNNL